MGIFGNRTRGRTDAPADTTRPVDETPAERADREAYEAERVEARERADHDHTAVRRDYDDDRRDRDVVVEERPPVVHPIAATRDRFGGIDIPASLVGMLTALALLVLLGGLAGAAFGAFGYQTGFEGADAEEVAIGGLVAGWIVLFVAFLVGGWAAGRIARYDGARNGLMTGVWTLILAAALSALAAWAGSEYDVFANVELPQWFDSDALTTAALVSGGVAIATMLVAGLLGGLWGTRYHRIADETLLDAQDVRDVDVP